MVTFGLLSSVFDYLTFGVLLFVLHADKMLFRSGWFVESVVSASLVVLVIRSRRVFVRSRPSPYLLATTMAVVLLAVAFPFTPLGALFGFVPLPPVFLVLMGATVALYIAAAEAAKRLFYARVRL